jgi:hypothetical protein
MLLVCRVFFCLRRSRRSCFCARVRGFVSLAFAVSFRWRPRFRFAGIRGFVSLASAISFRFAGVAPVRGGTYFSLPPQRKVGKRKRAHTASPCHYPRALHVPTLHTATRQSMRVANALRDASPASITRTRAARVEASPPICGKRCVARRTTRVGARNVFWQEHSVSRRESLHTVCRKGARAKR